MRLTTRSFILPLPLVTAFARIDLVATVLIATLLVLLCGSALATNRGGADRGSCLNNLRRIGQAALGWGLNHQGEFPWRLAIAEGGTAMQPKSGNAWLEFAYLSNYLVSPTILVCPADETTKVAVNWGRESGDGFVHPTSRGRALSYIVGLETSPLSPNAFLSGDRHLLVDARVVGCSSGVNNAAQINSFSSKVSWTNAIHGPLGHILFGDGRVVLLSNPQLRREALKAAASDNGSMHFLAPR